MPETSADYSLQQSAGLDSVAEPSSPCLIRREIHRKIDEVRHRFIDSPNSMLTEDDLRLQLGSRLLDTFGSPKPTADDDESIELHSEARWYGQRALKYRFDLVLLDTSKLLVLHGKRQPLESKGYTFYIPKAVIELKLRRPGSTSDNKFISLINEDVQKLGEIRRDLADEAPNISCWLVAFDKKKDIGARVNNLRRDGINIVYAFSSSKHRVLPNDVADVPT